jgi:hypothetical protein
VVRRETARLLKVKKGRQREREDRVLCTKTGNHRVIDSPESSTTHITIELHVRELQAVTMKY